MWRSIFNKRHWFVAIFILLVVFTHTATAQLTGFTYQGRLNDNNQVANGNFDFEFKLFTALTGGNQDGTPREVLNVVVTNGVFTVLVDFGAGAFPGADRFLEIGVRPAGGGAYTTLTPRQQVTITPYAIKSASATSADFALNANDAQNAVTATNATHLGGVAASQYVLTADPRLIDARTPLPGSTNYIQNSISQQAASNFNINGNGTAGMLTGNIVSATTQYNFATTGRILAKFGLNNLYVGTLAGNANGGMQNTLVGDSAGRDNTGNENALFGFVAGQSSTTGSNNSFFGSRAGFLNATGGGNSFFGKDAGNTNTTGSNNTILGNDADVGANNLTNASAFGYRSFVETSNSLVLGGVAGKNGATVDTNVGIGTTTPNTPLDIETQKLSSNTTADLRLTNFGRFFYISSRSSRGARSAPSATTSDDILLIIGAEGYTGSSFTNVGAASIYFVPTQNWNAANNGTKISFLTTSNGDTTPGTRLTINHDGRVGIGPGIVNVSPAQLLDVAGTIRVGPNSTNLGCIEDRDGTVIAGSCSSDLRFKKDISSFSSILNNFTKLRPVNFFWRTDEYPDKQFGKTESFGLIAQEVEQIFPDLVATDESGYKLVNYSKLPLLTIQAVKELKVENDALKAQLQSQQVHFLEQLATHQTQLATQQHEMESLKRLVCLSRPDVEVCK